MEEQHECNKSGGQEINTGLMTEAKITKIRFRHSSSLKNKKKQKQLIINKKVKAEVIHSISVKLNLERL